jgi:N-glycosylase/DNA lyase
MKSKGPKISIEKMQQAYWEAFSKSFEPMTRKELLRLANFLESGMAAHFSNADFLKRMKRIAQIYRNRSDPQNS